MNTFRSILTGFFILASGVALFAAPPSKSNNYTRSAIQTTEAFQDIKPGEKVAIVCKECQSLTVTTIAQKADAMKLCKEGDSVTCPSCKKTVRIVRRGPPGRSGTVTSKIVYVNEKGEECMFVTKVSD